MTKAMRRTATAVRMVATTGASLTAAWIACLCGFGFADEPAADPPVVRHQITGLFCPEREQDFRTLCAEKLARFKLVAIDYENAEATFAYDPSQEFPGAKPEQATERFDQEVKNASRHTFGVRPLRTKKRDELQRVEFLISGLDCKACSLAVYEILARHQGVEQATASFKTGRAIAWIDPRATDRAALEKALRERSVTLRPSE